MAGNQCPVLFDETNFAPSQSTPVGISISMKASVYYQSQV